MEKEEQNMAGKEIYKRKVHYYETDQMGIVHHSNYIRWFEEARIDMMEKMGLGYEVMEAEGIISPVLTVQADYLRMMHFGDTFSVKCFIKEYNGIKLSVGYEVINEGTGMVHSRGTTKHCFIDKTGRPLSLKQAQTKFHEMFLEGLEAYKREHAEEKEKNQNKK